MNKMTVIQLLNKIANGEELPKKIRFDNINWNNVYGEKYMYYMDDYDNDFFLYFFRKNLDFTLNDEIEIIEEDKKIEKLNYNNNDEFDIEGFTFDYEQKMQIVDKINEIIDYINEGDK